LLVKAISLPSPFNCRSALRPRYEHRQHVQRLTWHQWCLRVDASEPIWRAGKFRCRNFRPPRIRFARM